MVEEFPLKTVVIGCKSQLIYGKICSAFGLGTQTHETANQPNVDRTCGDIPITKLTSSSKTDTETLPFIKTWASFKQLGRRIHLEYGKYLSQEALDAFDLSTNEEVDLHDAKVIATTPFCHGYIDHSTEIVVLKLPPELQPVTKHVQKRTPPIVSQFLTHYELSHSKPEKRVIRVQLLKDGEEHSIEKKLEYADSHTSVVVSNELAHEFGVMTGGCLMVKIHKSVRKSSRLMQVLVCPDMVDGNRAMMSQVAWYNLGGKTVDESYYISMKPASPESPSFTDEIHFSPSSTSLTDMDCSMPQAKRITVAPINLVTEVTEATNSMTDSLRTYFSRNRFLRIGDVFLIDCKTADGQAYQRIMKVLRINNTNKSKSTYKVNQDVTVYENTSVHGYILPTLSSTPVKIDESFSSIRSILLNLLKPFVVHTWSPSPIPLMLLSGAEGSGKSLVVQQVAQILQCNYLETNCVHLVADTITSTENRIRDLLLQTQAMSPVILVLRNIHVLTKEEINNIENPRVVQFFQSQLEKTMVESDWPVIVFGTCEKMKTVSDGIREIALHEQEFTAPDVDERLCLLEELCATLTLHPIISLGYLADHTAGCLYGDLKSLVIHAQRNALCRAYEICEQQVGSIKEDVVDKSRILITKDDFTHALNTIQSLQARDLGAPKIPNVQWSDVGGLKDVKDDILDMIQLPLQHPELFRSNMKRSGVLLYGPPGTGKTLLAKAVATECALNFFSVKGPELINMYVGQSEENVRDVFHKARNAAPCVIFFDELDSLAPNRGRSGDSGGVMDRVVSQLLAELDGLHKSADVFVIGATNRPDLIDPALLRPGRFDKLVFVGVSSTPEQQHTILNAITRKFHLEKDCDLKAVCQLLPRHLTGADLYSLCAEAVTNCIKRQIDHIEQGIRSIDDCQICIAQQDFLLAAEEIAPSLSVDELERYEQIRLQFTREAMGNNPTKI